MPQAKTKKRAKILEYLEIVAPILPSPLYWFDTNNIALGANQEILKASGANVREAYVGKSYHQLYHERADKIVAHNQEIMRTGKILAQEEPINDITTGELKYFTAVKGPLYDEEGNIIGIVGTSIDITAEKEAERLRLENEGHKAQLHEQEKFTKIAAQVAHDIKSPTASLLMLVKSCQDIPEKERIALREATIRIQDIANNLLSYYLQQDKTTNHSSPNEQPESILASALMLELLAEKKLQYQDFPIKFDDHFSQVGHFAFIKIEPSAFKRMLSNLINNSVDAFDDKEGKVVVSLDASHDWVKIVIEDTGKGMRPELVEKIMSNIAVTEGKKQGHGLGLTQVRETLQRNQGKLVIESKVGRGTKITLTFPRIKASNWIAEEVSLTPNDTVVILDDDTSIHGAWDAHFESVLEKAPTIKVIHFTIGADALKFINSLEASEKKKIFLLSDYELLRQDLNGLDVIEQSGLKRSILVTSHYANADVREHAAKTRTKILPKQLASEIPIIVNAPADKSAEEVSSKQIDLVVMDDDEMFLNLLVASLSDKHKVEGYQNPHEFLHKLHQYAKDTILCFDYDFKLPDIDGLKLAEKLHEAGYTRLYMISGMNFKKGEIPNYLTLVDKSNLDLLDTIK